VTLWFVVPAHGRLELTRICLRQLRRTCDALDHEGITASAVVIACDENLDTARDQGFATIERDNQFLSRRYNDGIQLACDPAVNPRPVDHVVPCGSDDWVDHRLFLEPPRPHTVLGFQHISFVREDGQEITSRFLNYIGGSGIRVYPQQVVQALNYRPADEDRKRACDTSILFNLKAAYQRAGRQLKVEHRESDPWQIVDWKSPREQLNSYRDISLRYRSVTTGDPFDLLADVYPADSLDEMVALYASRRELVAA
jgi:hypothetical protein